MSGVRAAHDVHFMDTDLFFFADALEHALRPRPLHANLDSGILGFERLAQPFREWNFHRRVERERTLLAGGLDHGRADRGWLWRRTLERLRKNSAKCHSHRCVEHITSRKLPISHGVRSPNGGLARAGPGYASHSSMLLRQSSRAAIPRSMTSNSGA